MKSKATSLSSLRFECTSCGECCRRPGMVELDADDIERLMTHLGVDDITLFETYRIEGFDAGFAIHVEEGAPCTFLDGDLCSVFEVRPEQCRTYPFWPELLESRKTWREESQFCPGIGEGPTYSKSEIDRLQRGDGATKPALTDENA